MHFANTGINPEKTKQRNIFYYEEAYSDIQRIRKTYEARLLSRNILCLPELKNVENLDYLEIGYGSGLTLEAFWNKGLGSATGIEQSEKATRYLQNRLVQTNGTRKLNLIRGSAENTIPKLVGRQFDLIVLSNFIEHVKNDATLLKDLYLLLKPAGRLCITYPTPFSNNDPSHFRTYTPESIAHLILHTLKDPIILRNQYQSPCILGWLYAHIPPLLLKPIQKMSQIRSNQPGSSFGKKNRIETIVRNIYHKYFVSLMILAAPADDWIGRWLGFGHQGIILVQKKEQ